MIKRLSILFQICILVMITTPASSQASSDVEFVQKCSKGSIHPSLAFGTYIEGQINSGGFYYTNCNYFLVQTKK